MRSFLNEVVNDLIRRVGVEGLGQYTIVTPMSRGGIWLQEALRKTIVDQAIMRPVMLPECITIGELVGQLSDLRADDEIRSVVKLHALYTEFVEGEPLPLDVFYGWGKQLLQDFSSIDMGLVDADKLFSNAIAAHRLEEVELDEEVRIRLEELIGNTGRAYPTDGYRWSYEQLWSVLPQIYHAFNDWEREQGIGYTGARLRQVIEHWDEEQLGDKQFAFVGFNYLLKGEKKLLQLLKPRSLYYWDYDPAFQTNQDAYRFIRANIDEIGQTVIGEPAPTMKEAKPVQIIATGGSGAQAQYVHDWIRDKKGPTAIVIADENILESVIYALPDTVIQAVNITKGYPLRLTAAYKNRQITPNNYEENTSEQIPFVQLLEQEAAFQVSKVIDRVHWLIEQGELVGAEDEHVKENIITRILDTISLPFHGQPVTELQLIGVLETRLMDFENLIVLNVEEGVVPKVSRDISFIPYYLRKAYGLETNDESSAAYAYNFFRLMRRAKNITLMFSQASTGDQQKTMSRFLMQMITSPEFEVTKARIAEGTTAEPADPRKRVNPNWLRDTIAASDRHQLTLSPSDINTYLRCPMWYYLSRIEKVPTNRKIGLLLENNELGSLIHAMIKASYERILGTLPKVVTKAAITDYLNNPDSEAYALQRGYDILNDDYLRRGGEADHYHPEEHPLENQVAWKQVQNVLRYDSRETYLELIEMENYHAFEINVEGPEQPIKVRIGGFVDRLDRVEKNGQRIRRVVDYKTGSYKPDNEQYIRQTMLYCEQVGGKETIVPALLYTTQTGADENYSPYLNYREEAINDYESVRAPFMDEVKDIVTTIVNDTTMKQTEVSECQPGYCPFKTICGRPEKSW